MPILETITGEMIALDEFVLSYFTNNNIEVYRDAHGFSVYSPKTQQSTPLVSFLYGDNAVDDRYDLRYGDFTSSNFKTPKQYTDEILGKDIPKKSVKPKVKRFVDLRNGSNFDFEKLNIDELTMVMRYLELIQIQRQFEEDVEFKNIITKLST